MAKIKRVIRKLNLQGEPSFDEQLWPVNLALLVLGSFLVGVVLTQLSFDEPRWYANAWTSLLAIPIVIGSAMIALRYVTSRVVRRALQFSVVISLLIHMVLILIGLKTTLFSTPEDKQVAKVEVTPKKQPTPRKSITDVTSVTKPDEKMPFDKPIETPTPELETPKETPTKETKAEPEPTVSQSAPVPDPPKTPVPQVNNKPKPQETVPRLSEQQSKISRNVVKHEPRPNLAVDKPEVTKPTETPKPKVESQPSSVSRQSPDAQPNVKSPQPEPTTQTVRPTPQLTRQETQVTPKMETTAKPTAQKQVNQPTVTPRSQVQMAELPTPAKQTEPNALAPRATNPTKQETNTSPQVATKATEPQPTSTTQPTPKTDRVKQVTETKPTIAQTPTPVQNQRPRVTNRPDVATTANTVSPSPSPSPTKTPTLEASESVVQKKANDTPSPKTTTTAEPTTPTTPQQVVSKSKPEATTEPVAKAATENAPSLSRQAGKTNPTPIAKTEAKLPEAVARQTATGEMSPTSVATRKQDIESPQLAKAPGAQTVAAGAKSPVALDSSKAAKQKSEQAGPQIAAAKNITPGRKTSETTGNVVTKVADVTSNSSPNQSTDLNPQPSSSTVARQTSASNPSATRNQTPQDTPQQAASNQIAQGAPQRNLASNMPALTVAAGTDGSLSRTTRRADNAASPTNVESPALAAAAEGKGDTSAQPARMAMSKSLAGTSGVGRSANLDKASPNGESPALVASGSAQRAKATQTTAEGPAFAPSAPATISRSVAGAERPSSTVKAEAVELATTGGSQSVSDLNASASAAVSQANSNAAKGAVTGAKGNVEVDLGATQIVSDTGKGRAAGGGQPELNSDANSQQIARNKAGGAPLMSIASTTVATVAQAPAGGQTGSSPAMEVNAIATATVRTEAGGASNLSGGPSMAEKGTAAELNTAPLLADAAVSRAKNTEAAAGGGGGGQPQANDKEEEEKGRHLAKAAGGGAPKLALSAPIAVESPSSGPGDGSSKEGMVAADAASVPTARMNTGNSPASAGGGPASSAADAGGSAGGGAQVMGVAYISRAEAVDAAVGAPTAGGGTAATSRATAGKAFASNTQAEEVAMASAPSSSGTANGVPFEASGTNAEKLPGGVAGTATKQPVGTASGQVAAAVEGGESVGTAVGPRQTSPGKEAGPVTTDVANGGAPLPRADQSGLPGGVVSNNLVEIPQVAAVVAEADEDHMGGAMNKGSVTRRATGNIPIELAMADGPGGLSRDFATDVGITRRPASPDSLDVQLRESRFIRQAVGGLPTVSTTALVTAEMFKRRVDRAQGKKEGGSRGQEPLKTEEAIELGLAYVAKVQSPDGSWSLKNSGEPVALASDTAATALSTLAFLGAGYHHRDFKYKDTVRGGLDYLIKNQKPDGDLFVPLDDASNRSVRLYSHAIAAMALCEAYLTTNDEALKDPAQRAINFIVASQHKQYGGWRYTPGLSADTSVTGWMVVALKYGRDAGLNIPPDTFTKVNSWVQAAQVSPQEKHLYRYNPYAPDTEMQRHGRAPTKTMTAVGLVMRIYLGEKAEATDLEKGALYLEGNLPSLGTLRESERDTYYWYYATLFMHYMGGEKWENWNRALHPLLVDSQVKSGPNAGSWDPNTPVPDRWALHAGRLYVTTMNLLSLEVRWRGIRQSDNANK